MPSTRSSTRRCSRTATSSARTSERPTASCTSRATRTWSSCSWSSRRCWPICATDTIGPRPAAAHRCLLGPRVRQREGAPRRGHRPAPASGRFPRRASPRRTRRRRRAQVRPGRTSARCSSTTRIGPAAPPPRSRGTTRSSSLRTRRPRTSSRSSRVAAAGGCGGPTRAGGTTRSRYEHDGGDPLRLAGAVERLGADRRIDAEGWATDADWLVETAFEHFPDPLHRLRRAMTGDRVRNRASVLYSLGPSWAGGWHSAVVGSWMRGGRLSGTHGGLDGASSLGFLLVADPTFTLPPVVRSEDALGTLRDDRRSGSGGRRRRRLSPACLTRGTVPKRRPRTRCRRRPRGVRPHGGPRGVPRRPRVPRGTRPWRAPRPASPAR